MTWSIIARDPLTGQLGIVVASRFFAVGGVVPHMRGGLGAIATQAFISPMWGTEGLKMLEGGASPQEVIDRLVARDEGHPNRQLHLIDAQGRSAAFTGAACIDWCGHLAATDVSIAGNMLEGPQVLEATLRTYQRAMDRPFAERLLSAMQAGEDAGGDKRGRQSAALVVHDEEDSPLLDIRVDDHADPLAELARLELVSRERAIHARRFGPTRDNPTGLLDRAALEVAIQRSVEEGYR